MLNPVSQTGGNPFSSGLDRGCFEAEFKLWRSIDGTLWVKIIADDPIANWPELLLSSPSKPTVRTEAGMNREDGLTENISTTKGFGGYRVAAFEARFAQEMAKLIASHGGEPLVAPAMAEVPLGQNVSAFEFAERLFRGELPVVVFLTGVGTRALFEVVETRYIRAQLVEALGKVAVIARGPKPVSALRSFGVPVAVAVPEPNTWRELLEAMDASDRCPALKGLTVAVQEYGVPNAELLQELKNRGANVLQVAVYRWALPKDTGPLEEAIQSLIAGDCQVALFTNAMQVSHLFQLATQMGVTDPLRDALWRVVVGSVGPVCSQALHDVGVVVDLEPRHPRMGSEEVCAG